MARIRTIKPEAFTSESLAEVSVHAERTFVGLLTQADDHGRFRDNPAVIAGLLWPLRAEHTPVHVEEDLQQLSDAGLICRYVGCDGRRYLHIVTWFEHQKIDKPSQTRIPACPDHHATQRCGSCKTTCSVFADGQTNTPRGLSEPSGKDPRSLDRPSKQPATPPGARSASASGQQATLDDTIDASRRAVKKTAGQKPVGEVSPKTPRTVPEASAPGSRILDPGSTNPSGRTAPASTVSANQLVGEYVTACDERPPSDVIGHLGRIVKKLLGEGISPEHVRGGLQRFAANPKHPSVLTSMVNEAMNAHPSGLARPGIRPNVPAHQAWTNPANAAAAYAEEL
ncbi:hypothetical protein K2224_28840 (plasmid) [Streptomyces sp. BHT-5-2]|uniref:hypothetical protein n=1 Tax=Streptomyces sp. BHT-5-2 TaxID=2866715 RepID=UPI001C8E93DD|nr:hypothetical protein [Streptomyces sp. BHT-5-2]QZL07286.1 hypothetical protein K2224_28840 [Streptomyces sp. BHT-5-2]